MAYDVIIVGAGVGGGSLALALGSQFPVRVLVLEKRAGPANVNRGDSLLPAATSHFAAWGALDRFRANGARFVTRMQVCHHRAGLVFESPLVPAGAEFPYLCLPHERIERTLAEAAVATGRVEIRYSASWAGLIEEDGRVAGVIFEDGSRKCEARAKVVVGADGHHSPLRSAIGIPFHSKRYRHGFFVVDLHDENTENDIMQVNLHPDGGVLVVPGPGRIGVAAMVDPKHESLFGGGPIEPKISEIFRRVPAISGRAPFPGAHLYQVAKGHASRYVSRGAALIGDAVHVTNPTAGQGMTMAIEDAAALARRLGPALAAGADAASLDPLLAAYEQERRPRNAVLIRRSHWMSLFYSFGGQLGDSIRRRVFSLGRTFVGQAVQRTIWSQVAARRTT